MGREHYLHHGVIELSELAKSCLSQLSELAPTNQALNFKKEKAVQMSNPNAIFLVCCANQTLTNLSFIHFVQLKINLILGTQKN